MATIIFVMMVISLLLIFALDTRHKVRQQIVEINKRSSLLRR